MEQYDERTWFDPQTGDQVSLTYIALVPDLPAPLDDLPLLRRRLATETAEVGALIEAHVVTIDSVPTLYQLLKLPIPDQASGQAFIAAFTVPKATCSVVLRIQCAEGATTGVRESGVLAQVGPEAFVRPHPYAPELEGRLPWHVGDDAQWDGQFPDHPLTRARAWAQRTMATARIDPAFAQLPPFEVDGAAGPAPADEPAGDRTPEPAGGWTVPPSAGGRPRHSGAHSREAGPDDDRGGPRHSGAHARPDPDTDGPEDTGRHARVNGVREPSDDLVAPSLGSANGHTPAESGVVGPAAPVNASRIVVPGDAWQEDEPRAEPTLLDSALALRRQTSFGPRRKPPAVRRREPAETSPWQPPAEEDASPPAVPDLEPTGARQPEVASRPFLPNVVPPPAPSPPNGFTLPPPIDLDPAEPSRPPVLPERVAGPGEGTGPAEVRPETPSEPVGPRYSRPDGPDAPASGLSRSPTPSEPIGRPQGYPGMPPAGVAEPVGPPRGYPGEPPGGPPTQIVPTVPADPQGPPGPSAPAGLRPPARRPGHPLRLPGRAAGQRLPGTSRHAVGATRPATGLPARRPGRRARPRLPGRGFGGPATSPAPGHPNAGPVSPQAPGYPVEEPRQQSGPGYPAAPSFARPGPPNARVTPSPGPTSVPVAAPGAFGPAQVRPPAPPEPAGPPRPAPPELTSPMGATGRTGSQPIPGRAPTADPPVEGGDVMHTVLIGLPIGGYLPLWHENSVSYWRMSDPAGIRGRLGVGLESRTEIDNRRFREAALFTPDRNTLFLMDRQRNSTGHLGGASTQLIPATEEEAFRAANDKAMSDLYSWIGDIVVAAGERGEYVAIETGGWHVPVTPVVLIMLRTDGNEWHSVVETSPVPVGAPVWRDQQPVEGDTQLLASPATDRTMRAAGLLTRFAVATWPLHPFQLGLSFGPNPTLGDVPTR